MALILVVGLALRLPILVALVIATLIGELFLADLDLGPFSVRVYLLAVALGVLIWQAVRSRENPLRSRQAILLVVLYLVFVGWAILNRLYNGESVAAIAHRIGSTHLIALVGFIVTQAALRRQRDTTLVAVLMVATALLSGLVGIVQWLGPGWSWDLALLLRPGEPLRRLIFKEFVPGLALYSLPLSYHLISFGMFILAWIVLRPPTSGPLALGLRIVVLFVYSVAILVTQSRSAVLAALVSLAFVCVWFYRRRRAPGVSGSAHGRAILFVLVVNFSLVGLTYLLTERLVSAQRAPGEGRYSLSRIFTLRDRLRGELTTTAVEVGLQNAALGGGLSRYNESLLMSTDRESTTGLATAAVAETTPITTPTAGAARIEVRHSAATRPTAGTLVTSSSSKTEPIEYPLSPHNMFLNALVDYGVPGVMLLLPFLAAVYATCRRALRATADDPRRHWIALGAVLGLIAYVVNSQFHNENFAAGGTLPWWLIGVLCALIAQARKCGDVDGRGTSTP